MTTTRPTFLGDLAFWFRFLAGTPYRCPRRDCREYTWDRALHEWEHETEWPA